MSDKPHTPHDPHAPSASADDVEQLPASVRAAWAEWAELTVPPLAADFTDAVMLELHAVERAQAWESAFVPALAGDFAEQLAELAMREGLAQQALTEWSDAHIPALPADFAATVTDAALADEAAREGARHEAYVAWGEQFVPDLPADFAATITDAVMKSAQDELRTSGVVEKSAHLRAVGSEKPASAPASDSRGGRRWIAPAAVSTFAAAAVAIFALVGGPGRTSTTAPTGSTHPVAQPTRNTEPHPTLANQTPQQRNGSTTNATASNGASTGATDVASDELGSEVEKVDVDGDRASFAAFSIQGEDDHSSVAVVWIDDGDKNPTEAPATL